MTSMDDFKIFFDRVLTHIPRATIAERDAIRQELNDHMEDHLDILLEGGMDESQARSRVLAAMGDPKEIGSAWNRQLSPVWLWTGRLCQVCCIALIIAMFWSFLAQMFFSAINLSTRFSVDSSDRPILSGYGVSWQQDLDIREEFGQHILGIYRVELVEELSPQTVTDALGHQYINVYLVSYAKNPFHSNLDRNIFLNELRCNGETSPSSGSGGGRSHCWTASFPVEEGAECVEITLDHYGQHFSAEIELDWGGAV